MEVDVFWLAGATAVGEVPPRVFYFSRWREAGSPKAESEFTGFYNFQNGAILEIPEFCEF